MTPTLIIDGISITGELEYSELARLLLLKYKTPGAVRDNQNYLHKIVKPKKFGIVMANAQILYSKQLREGILPAEITRESEEPSESRPSSKDIKPDCPLRGGANGKYKLEVKTVTPGYTLFEYMLVDADGNVYKASSRCNYPIGSLLRCIITFAIERAKFVVRETRILGGQDLASPIPGKLKKLKPSPLSAQTRVNEKVSKKKKCKAKKSEKPKKKKYKKSSFGGHRRSGGGNWPTPCVGDRFRLIYTRM